MLLKINRVASKMFGTFGVFMLSDGTPFAVTLERPWADNKKGLSCIPANIYLCKRIKSGKFGDTFEVDGVPGRDAILFHKGNINNDTHGCILVGEQFEPLGGVPGIAASAKGFAEFLSVTKDESSFVLEIFETFK